MDISRDLIEKMHTIKPRSVVYLFSGGKDSALALLLTRDFIKQFCNETKCKTYVVYIYVTGNTHPLNAYCAQYVLKFHEQQYGFTPIMLANSKLFPELMCRYGFEILKNRWCYVEMKLKPLLEFEQRLPKPVIEIDGMTPDDSVMRSEAVTDELQEIKTEHRHYWAWHPLYNKKLDKKQKIELLKQYKEFDCVAKLYEAFEDSMNCVICPYKPKEKLMKLCGTEPAQIYYNTIEACVKSDKWKEKFGVLNCTKKILEYIK